MGARVTVARWLMASPAARVGGSVAAVVLGISGLFGGLDPVPIADRLPEVSPGTEVTVQPFALTLEAALAVEEFEGGIVGPPAPGNHLMVVLLRAENLSDESVGSYPLSPVPRAKSALSRNLVVLDDRLGPESASVLDADSNTGVSLLSPGLSYHLAIAWEFSGPVPTQLPVGLTDLTLRGNTISPDVLEWQDPEEAATVTLPVQDQGDGPG